MKSPWLFPLGGWCLGACLSPYCSWDTTNSEVLFGTASALILLGFLVGFRRGTEALFFLIFALVGGWRTRWAFPPEPPGLSTYQGSGILWDERSFEDEKGLQWRLVWRDTVHIPREFPSSWSVEGRVEPLRGPKVPGGFSARAVYRPQGYSGTLWVERGSFLDTNAVGHSFRGWSIWLQSKASKGIDSWSYSGETRGLIQALLVGDRSNITPELRNGFARLGLAHIVSISGFHMSLIFSFFARLAQKRGPHRGWGWEVVGLVLVLGFTAVSGSAPSAVRSALMTAFTVVGRWIHRPQEGLHSLTLMALILLVIFPLWVWDLGFQLSVLSLAGIMLWTPKKWSAVESAWWTSWSAQMATLPLTVLIFHQFSWVFLFSNAVAGPLFELLLAFWMIQGGIEGISSAVIPDFGGVFIWRSWEWIWAQRLDLLIQLFIDWGLHPSSASDGLYPSTKEWGLLILGAWASAWTVWKASGRGRWLLFLGWIPVWIWGVGAMQEPVGAHLVVYKARYSWILEVCTPDTTWACATPNQWSNAFFWKVESAPSRIRLRGSAALGGQVTVAHRALHRTLKVLPDWDSTAVYQRWKWRDDEWRRVELLR